MKQNKGLKAISFIVLPIAIMIIIISIVYTFAKNSYKQNMSTYFETISFTSDYMNLISNLARATIYIDDNYSYIKDENYKIYYVDINDYNYRTRLKDNFVLIIYGNKAVTNVNTRDINTIEEIKNYISNEERGKSKYYKRKSKFNNTFSEI